jgi:hypothetical protein
LPAFSGIYRTSGPDATCSLPGTTDARCASASPSGSRSSAVPPCRSAPVLRHTEGGAERGEHLLLPRDQIEDEPTDNLDLESAEAPQEGLEAYEGTVLAVTHDRWFARSFDRFLVFGSDGRVRETPEPVWDERRVERAR